MNCVITVTPMLSASMITVRPISTSIDFSMIAGRTDATLAFDW
jgi:hypothetical protein